MSTRLATFLLLGPVMLAMSIGTHAQASAPVSTAPHRDLHAELKPLPNDLARYRHLLATMPADNLVARQLLASLEDQLGRYNGALVSFPFDNRIVPPASMPLPQASEWRAGNAIAAITARARRYRIVMVNEAHHDAYTRELTLELLPKLHAEGFRYLAIEALAPDDPGLMKRGYAIDASGSEYLHEPVYGEIVRQAIRLGYTLVPYDSDATTSAGRESGQARNIYHQVFAKDPHARLLVHAGYAHVDKAAGNLGDGVQPMAVRLERLTGLAALSIDQAQFRDIAPGQPDHGAYGTLIERFHPVHPVVLRQIQSGELWSADPAKHDISVILPRAGTGRRPGWLSLDGRRQAWLVNTDLCHAHVPCIVEAHYADEPDAATAADRYTFLHDDEQNVLYLYPGSYRLRAVDASGKTLDERRLHVDGH